MNLNQRISALRNHRRLTQEQVANALGVKRARYNAWENGISNPDHVMLAALAQFHGVSVDFLLGLQHPDGDANHRTDKLTDNFSTDSFLSELANELERNHRLTRGLNSGEVETIAAHHDGEEWTDEEREEIERFKAYIRSKRKPQE
ncbi:helix-turn-helix transcriptional regulator [Paenibacillus sp. PR3]|uniref:Helix-turn-helix transcriptional regulator n=1 Tax=Paenibacillus terricola TaxID=2763503 RepID=A0ABR8MS11_9BACL|nr:helix-turn-helix transcriptional regulator [Paenibacillus terricola]MBD3917625.1 helix-turn-helix transcriptional regulator [Paenibacillus terricola]